MLIRSLRPNVTREEAIGHFAGEGLRRVVKSAFVGPLHSTADLYIPYGVFRVRVANARRDQTTFFGLDLVRGTFDLYQFEGPPSADSLVEIDTENRTAPLLDVDVAQRTIVERVRRLVFMRGFFRVRGLEITAEPVQLDIHVPYWLGLWRRKQRIDFVVLDAVRRRREGAKVREFVREWLAQ